MLSSLPFSPALPAAPSPAPSGAPATPSSGQADGAAPGAFSQALDEAKAPPPERTAASRGRINGPTGGPDKAPRTLPGKPQFSSLPEAEDGSTVKAGSDLATTSDKDRAGEQVNDLLAQLQSQAQLQLLVPQGAAALAQARAAVGAAVGAGGGAAGGAAVGAAGGAASHATAELADDGSGASSASLLGALSVAAQRLTDGADAKGGGSDKGSDKGSDARPQTRQLQELLAGAAEKQALQVDTLSAATASLQGPTATEGHIGAGEGGFVLSALSAGAAQAAAPGSSPWAPAEARLPARPGSPDFAPQLGTQLSTFVRDGVEHARLHLNPAEMGPVSVRIQIDGQMAMVHLSADNAQTRQALEQAMPQLASQLRETGLTLTGGGVSEQPRQDAQAAADGRGEGGNESGNRGGNDRSEAGRDSRNEMAFAPTRLPQRRGVVDLVA